MDDREFIAAIIDSIAWPWVTIVVVWWLKDNIAENLQRLKKFKHKDTELELTDAVTAYSAQLQDDIKKKSSITTAALPQDLIESVTKLIDDSIQENEPTLRRNQIIHFLQNNPPTTTTKMVDLLGINRSYLYRILKELEKNEFIVSQSSGKDVEWAIKQ